jgi:aryl-alcohol dehydrogenase-like predicted oxidoreductase
MSETTTALPTRMLGATGCQVTVLALGGVKYHERSDAHAAGVVNRALDLGINYIDTAHSYGESERRIGLVMRDRREEVFLATKTERRDRDGARREIDESFRRLQTDRIDLLQVHDLADEGQLAQAMGPHGALRAMEEYVEAGQARFVGVTGHRYPQVLARALEEYPFDTLLVALGAMQAAVRPFYETVMPLARARGIGVIGMKVMAHGWFGSEGVAEQALRFVLGLEGVATALVGVDDVRQLEQNVRVARECRPLSESERDALLARARTMYERQPRKAWFIYK